MNKRQRQELRKELSLTGATAAETRQLLPIASRLGSLRGAEPAEASKSRAWQRIAKPAAFAASGLIAGILLIVVSQAVLPTSWLYPVQKFSDNIAVSIHPQYRANVMMKRAQQVNALVADHAGSRRILATLTDYAQEASAYKSMPHANYAAFEYCKTNLQQASATAPPAVRQAIADSLRSLEAV